MRLLAFLLGLALADAQRVVLGGVDVVEYFSLPKGANATIGSSSNKFTLNTHDFSSNTSTGVLARARWCIWRCFTRAVWPGSFEFWFKNQANRALFAKDPWQYAPKYGGF